MSHESASLRISVCTAIPKHMRDGTRELSHLFVPEEDRRQGYATALMRVVCEQADEACKVLILTVEPGDMSMTKEQLRDWYRRFGFIEIQEEPCLMARMVGATPRVLSH